MGRRIIAGTLLLILLGVALAAPWAKPVAHSSPVTDPHGLRLGDRVLYQGIVQEPYAASPFTFHVEMNVLSVQEILDVEGTRRRVLAIDVVGWALGKPWNPTGVAPLPASAWTEIADLTLFADPEEFQTVRVDTAISRQTRVSETRVLKSDYVYSEFPPTTLSVPEARVAALVLQSLGARLRAPEADDPLRPASVSFEFCEVLRRAGALKSCIETIASFGNDTYPLHVYGRSGDNGGATIAATRVSFHPGNGLIEPTSQKTARRPAETSSAGTGQFFETVFSEAADAVQRDPSLVQFADWKRQHVDTKLIGAEYADERGTCLSASNEDPVPEGPHSVWSMVFGANDGAFFVLRSVSLGGGARLQCEIGSGQALIDFSDVSWQPDKLPSIRELWGRAMQGSGWPDYFLWGPRWECRSTDPVVSHSGSPCSDLGLRFRDETMGWNRAIVGRREHVVDTRFFDYHYLALEIEVGEVLAWGRWQANDVRDLASQRDEQDVQNERDDFLGGGTGTGTAVGATVAIGAGLAFVLLFKGLVEKLPFFAAAYAKLTQKQVLDNVLRDQLLNAIDDDPGISRPRLHQSIGRGWTTISYHLQVLEKNGLVASLVHAHRRRYFPSQFGVTDRLRIATLRESRAHAVLEAIRSHPGLACAQIAQSVGCSPNVAGRHLRRLEKAGLVVRCEKRPARFREVVPA